MKILVINSGSSSIKYKVYKAETFEAFAEGIAERIGIGDSFIKHKAKGKDAIQIDLNLPNHKKAIAKILDLLVDKEHGVMGDIHEIKGVGHRIVHGGEDFTESALITDDVIKAIEKNAALAPLHNPPHLRGIEATQHVLPNVPMAAVFDTAIHQTMPKKAYMYAIPLEQYTKHKIRRYGFHGTSHGYVAKKAAEMLKKPLNSLKIITCHLGNGGSITAFDKGKSVDTSMGLTPLQGIMMGTRSGDMDPFIPLHIIDTQQLTTKEINTMMNKQGGLKAIAGHSDMRDIEIGYKKGTQTDIDALDMYTYSIQKYIGAYTAAMNGVDVIVFTAGVGENSILVREKVLENFTFMGLELDKAANEAGASNNGNIITTDRSKVTAMIIPTNEELVIAQDTMAIIGKK